VASGDFAERPHCSELPDLEEDLMPRADHGRLLWGPLKDTKPRRNLIETSSMRTGPRLLSSGILIFDTRHYALVILGRPRLIASNMPLKSDAKRDRWYGVAYPITYH